MDVAAARRLERPRWLNLRTTLGTLLFGIALLSGWSVLGTADTGYGVWVAAADLSSGTDLAATDVTAIEVDLPPEQLGHYLGSEVSLDGATLLQPLRRGQLVPSAWVSAEEPEATSRVITIPISADHAVGGALRPGDRVDVLASLDAGRAGARTTLLVGSAEVEDLLHAGSFVADDESLAGVTLEVSPEDAARLAYAIRSAELDLVRVEGPSTAVSIEPVRGADL